MSFMIAVDAGHYKNTVGNRLPKELDINKTSEWELNDRIARHFINAALEYEDVKVFRVDDTTGNSDVSLPKRCKTANDLDADFYLSIHHNAGVHLTNSGGIIAYSYKNSKEGAAYRDAIYDSCIKSGGLLGDRSEPKQGGTFYVLKYTRMNAVLMEYGFMDSRVDAPVILKDEYSKKMAYATMEAIARVANLKKKEYIQDTYEESTTVHLNVLRRGSTGTQVKAMQILLIGLGYSCGDHGADGKFGTSTEKALCTLQSDNGLKSDGICGELTWHKLLNSQ